MNIAPSSNKHSCETCSHFYCSHAQLGQPYPEWCCTKGHWHGLTCKEDFDSILITNDCIDYNTKNTTHEFRKLNQ